MRREAPELGPAERAYAANYRTRGRAAGYLSKYDTQLTKRWSTRREIAILRGLIAKAGARVGPLDAILDLPSGPGRLLAAHAPVPRRLVFGDIGEGMVRLALENAPPVRDQVRCGVLANVLDLPFRDGAFDCVISIRLAHHLEGRERFERYLREILRVSRGAAILTFFSARSLKNRIRGVSVHLGRRGPKKAVDPEIARSIAESAGFDWEEAIPLSRIGSGHLYVLLTRRVAKGTLLRAVGARSGGVARSAKAEILHIPAGVGVPFPLVAKRYPAAADARGLHRPGAARAAREWEALMALRAAGAPVARPVAAWPDPETPGAGWIATEEFSGARTLKEVAADPDGRGRALEAAVAVCRHLGRLHADGWVLGDTFAKNILVREGEGGGIEVRFIDQPRARREAARSGAARAQRGDLARLYKGLRDSTGRPGLSRLAAAYLEARGEDPDGKAAGLLASQVEALARRLANETPVSSFVDAAKRRIRRLLR